MPNSKVNFLGSNRLKSLATDANHEKVLIDQGDESVLWTIIALGEQCARRRGLQPDDAADCAVEFMLQTVQEGEITLPLDRLHHHADEYAYNYLRRKKRYWFRFKADSCHAMESEQRLQQLPDPAPTPSDCLMQRQVIFAVEVALEAFKPRDRHLVYAAYIKESDLHALAQSCQITYACLTQRLCRLRLRLKAELQETGWDEHDLRSCLTPTNMHNLFGSFCKINAMPLQARKADSSNKK